MTRSVSVLFGVAQRNLGNLLKVPPYALPPLIIPLFFFAAFAGALSGIGDTPSFGYYDYTAFQFVFALCMTAIFVGVFTAFDIAVDYESGLGARMMLATPWRMAIVAGYLVSSLLRCVVYLAAVWGIGLATGLQVKGGPLDIAGLVGLALLLNLATTLFGAGVALRLQTAAASILIIMPVFMLMFLAPVYTPRDELAGWLHSVANYNPMTAIFEAGRGFLANDPVSVGLAFACAAGLVLLTGIWAVLGMRKAERIL